MVQCTKQSIESGWTCSILHLLEEHAYVALHAKWSATQHFVNVYRSLLGRSTLERLGEILMRNLCVYALTASLSSYAAMSPVIAGQEDHVTVMPPLYRAIARDAQNERSRSDLRTTVQPVWLVPAEVETTGSVVTGQSNPPTVNVPLYREQIHDAQRVWARSDLRTTVQPIWVMPTTGGPVANARRFPH